MLKTTVERLEGSTVKLTVTVPAEDVDRAIDSTYKSLGKKYRFPGFRPGKAPRPILDQQLGREYILAEATEHVVNTTYSAALDLEALRPIESPEIDDLDTVEAGKEFTYSADIDVRPELTLSDYAPYEVALPPREATQDEIDIQIELTKERFATLSPIEDRGVEPGDFVVLSFVGTVDGEAYEGNEVDMYLYEMNRGLMPPEFDTGIVGAKPGDERRVEFEIPDTSSNPDYVGKTAGFDITIHEIKSKLLPELDDEFAANVGGYDSVDEMIADIKGRIDLQKGSAHDRLRERRIREALAERLVGDIPEAMIVARRDAMMRDFYGMLESREMHLEEYLASAGMDMEGLEKDMREQAELSVREELALEALFREKGMEVTEDDVDAELKEISSSTESTPEETRKRWEDLGLMPVVREQIMHRKAIMWLMENVTVVEEAPENPEPTEAEAKKKPAAKKSAAKKPAAKKPAAKKTTKKKAEPAEADDAEKSEE